MRAAELRQVPVSSSCLWLPCGFSCVQGRLASRRIYNVGSIILRLFLYIFSCNCFWIWVATYAVLAPTSCHQPVFVVKGSPWATSSLGMCAEEWVFCADGPSLFHKVLGASIWWESHPFLCYGRCLKGKGKFHIFLVCSSCIILSIHCMCFPHNFPFQQTLLSYWEHICLKWFYQGNFALPHTNNSY